MNRDQAKQYIIEHSKDYLQPDKSGKGWICPICGSGSGDHGTGITTKDGTHFTCWAGCFTSADIIDIIGQANGLSDYNSKLQRAAQEFNITIEGGGYRHRSSAAEDFRPAENQNQPKNERITQHTLHNTQPTQQNEEPEEDFTDFFLKAAADIEKTSYHRGLSLETLKRFRVGFVESWRHPKAPKMAASPRLIIPTGKSSYLARHASESDFINFRGQVENKSKVGKVQIFNAEAIKTATQPVFIVEGEIDAMSVCDVGAEAIGLGSVGNWKKLLALVEQDRPQQPFIISLDNDENPETRARVAGVVKELEKGLDRLGIDHYRADIAAPHKDANAALQADKKAFFAAVWAALERAEEEEAAALEAEREQLRQEAASYCLPGFVKDIEDSTKAEYFPTGFPELDELLDGGLYPGLYIVGAISSLGKTSFCLQVADQLAEKGRDVLIFSLEMARNELIAKSVSRLTLRASWTKYGNKNYAKTTRGILTGSRYKGYSQPEREIIDLSLGAYRQIAKHIFITEGIGNVGIEEIREKVLRHIKLTGKAPLVLIDYLQIIAPADMRATDKQNTDKAVLELKRMSRDYNIPVIGISSFNRDNYTAPVNLASFKESGAIEYSSDVLIGLQYDGMDYQEGETDKQRDKRIRELLKQAAEDAKNGIPQTIQVKILKNRNGSKGSASLFFYAMFNLFTGKAKKKDEESNGWKPAESSYK